jgi:serine protease Do
MLGGLAVFVALLATVLVAGKCGAEENAFAPAIAAAEARTVKIYGAGIGRSPGYASGIVVSADGEIITAQGVFLSAGNLRATLADGSTHAAEVLRRSDTLQLALLKIDAPTPEFFALHNEPVARQGDWILAVSNAFKVAEGPEPLSVNVGVLSLRMPLAARRGVQDFPYEGDVYLLDAITSNPGAAGGAVVNDQGNLVGMIGRVIEGKATGTRLNYAVPADLLREFLAGKTPPPVVASTQPRAKGELGIRLFSLGGRRGPAYIDRILPGSAAATVGLKSDDLVVTLAGQVVHNASDYSRIAETLAAGEEVVVEVKRKDQLLTLRLVLGERK